MRRFTSNAEIESLCEAMIRDFFGSRHNTSGLSVDIEDFVTKYLGIQIVYESFAEPDPGRIGFLSDGVRALWVWRDNWRTPVVFPADVMVIDQTLLDPKENARRRFTIAHEASHHMLGRHIPIQADPAAAFHSEFNQDNTYSPEMLKDMMSINEYFTNRAAACFLMPPFLVERVLKRYNRGRQVILYENGILSQDQKFLIQRMARAMGASYTAFFHRLRELDLFEVRPVEEYIHDGLCYGGEQ